MTKETRFQRYIPDTNEGLVSSNKVRKHILCSGQVYYALLKARQARNIEDVAISRIEQYSPFPYDLLQEHVDAYPNAQVMWVQEEPLNMGAWQYVGCRIQSTLHETQHHKHSTVQYVARDSTGSVATGNKKQHIQEEEGIIGAAFA
jgi:2-oxoglutarate dehydrogenase E1 component